MPDFDDNIIAADAQSMMSAQSIIYEYPGLRAVDDVSLEIRKGSITALVGPNGAGKTTLMQVMSGLARPIQGTVHLDGMEVYEEPRKVQARMGYLPDFFSLYDELTVMQCLRHKAAAHGFAGDKQKELIMQAARRVHLHRRLDQKAGELSRGLRQRLAIAQAIIHEPEFLMLDEPASGLDPEARYALSQMFRELSDAGMTLLVSSHILSELEDYCTHIAIMRGGQILEYGAIDGNMAEGGMAKITVSLGTEPADLEQAIHALCDTHDGLELIRNKKGRELLFLAPNNHEAHQALLAGLMALNWPIWRFSPAKASLQDAYLAKLAARKEEGSQDAES